MEFFEFQNFNTHQAAVAEFNQQQQQQLFQQQEQILVEQFNQQQLYSVQQQQETNTSHAVEVLLKHEIQVLKELESSKTIIDAALNDAAKNLEATIVNDDLFIVELTRNKFRHAIACTELSAWACSVVLNALDRAFNAASKEVTINGVYAPVAMEASMSNMEAYVVAAIKEEMPNVAALM